MNAESADQEKRPPLLQRAKRSSNQWLRRKGWSLHNRQLVFHYLRLIWEQVSAMLPITLLQVLVLAIFFGKSSSTPGVDAAGLLSAVAGLVLFLEGLRVAVMPMALLLGNQLPLKLKLPWVLLVAFCLGVLVTYAEPAIAAIRPLAKLVDPQSAPYLYYLMNQQQELLVLAIGVGVGLASVVGTLKFLTGTSIKPFIAGSLLPTVGLACYMQWGNPHLRPILGVAWDCGGVTTGPVTVPILLSLGVGVMKAQREKRQLQAVLENAAVKQGEGNTLEGFGIVTLASLLPVLAVEVMAIVTGAVLPYDYVLEQASLAASRAAVEQPALVDTSPVKEVLFGLRAISPLVVALILLVVFVLRQPLPDTGFLVDDADWEESEEEEEKEGDARTEEGEARIDQQQCGGSSGMRGEEGLGRDSGSTAGAAAAAQGVKQCSMQAPQPPVGDRDRPKDVELPMPVPTKTAAAAAASSVPASKPMHGRVKQPAKHNSSKVCIPQVAAAVVAAAEGDDHDYWDPGSAACSTGGLGSARGSRNSLLLRISSTLERVYGGGAAPAADTAAAAAAAAASRGGLRQQGGAVEGAGGCCGLLRRYSSLIAALVMCQVGMILFNIGLTYGFTALGDLTGSTLPTSFMSVSYAPGSPFYSFAGGIALTMVTVFLLGFLATRAEPALNVLGQTVETLSNRKFTKQQLVYAVCVGVAVGMCAGASKILFRLPLLYFILAKYTVACGLTVLSKEAVTAVAWDSAGVTTGPVTVPFVMSIGVGFSKAVGAPEGFGMLTIMSVAPIISVLLTSLLRKPVKRAAVELARLSKMSLSKVSLSKVSRRSNTIATAYVITNESSSSQRSDTIIDFAAELANNPDWSPSPGRASPVEGPAGSLAGGAAGQLARVSLGMAHTSRPLQPIGEHSSERPAGTAAAAVSGAAAGTSRLAVASAPVTGYSS